MVLVTCTMKKILRPILFCGKNTAYRMASIAFSHFDDTGYSLYFVMTHIVILLSSSTLNVHRYVTIRVIK
jgi:hypothetical protein